MLTTPLTPDALHSLEPLPGEPACPPLRLLERPSRQPVSASRSATARPGQRSWLEVLRRALALA